jgi:hypothetical protein
MNRSPNQQRKMKSILAFVAVVVGVIAASAPVAAASSVGCCPFCK